MLILFVHQNFPGQFRSLAPALVAAGHRVLSLSVNPSHGMPGIEHFQHQPARSSTVGIHPWVADLETKVIRGESAFRKALEMHARGIRPDLIVAHHGWGESLFLKRVWPDALLALYCEFHYSPDGTDVDFDPEFAGQDASTACRIDLKNTNNVLNMLQADAGISPTAWQASTFPLPFRERITVIHDGIDASVAAPNPAAALTLNGTIRLAPGDEVVTFVNRNLEPYRGYHTLMRALPEVLSRRPNARVVIVGGDGVSYGSPPPAGQTWRAIFWNEVATRVDPSRVHVVGSLPYEHYLALLQVSAAHVYLTYPFVLGWSCIEAMSVGCAIVGSDTPPVREVLRHDENALLVDFFDHGALADAVITLLGDRPMAARLGSAAREHVLRHYDLQTVCLPAQSNWIQTLLATATRRP